MMDIVLLNLAVFVGATMMTSNPLFGLLAVIFINLPIFPE